MGAISREDKDKIRGAAISISYYPVNGITEKIEELVQQTLPEIPELHPGLSEQARLAVYEAATNKSFREFVAMYGDPFGAEVADTPIAEMDDTANFRAVACELGV